MATDAKATEFKIGDTLKNGAILVAIAEPAADGYRAVLAVTPGAAEPYVSWRVTPEGDCFWGHYFRTLDKAAADWMLRAKGEHDDD